MFLFVNKTKLIINKLNEILVKTNFRSFVWFFLFFVVVFLYHSKMLLLVILFVNVRLYIIFDHSPIIPRHSVTKALKSRSSTTALREHVVTALGLPKGKRVTDDYSILEQEAVGFSLRLLY